MYVLRWNWSSKAGFSNSKAQYFFLAIWIQKPSVFDLSKLVFPSPFYLFAQL